MSKSPIKELMSLRKSPPRDMADLIMWLRDFTCDLCPNTHELSSVKDPNQILREQPIVKSVSARKRTGMGKKLSRFANTRNIGLTPGARDGSLLYPKW